jgi:hypothetical protein
MEVEDISSHVDHLKILDSSSLEEVHSFKEKI